MKFRQGVGMPGKAGKGVGFILIILIMIDRD